MADNTKQFNSCFLCKKEVEPQDIDDTTTYHCDVCGKVKITEELIEFESDLLKKRGHLISGFLREKQLYTTETPLITATNIKHILDSQYIPQEVIEKAYKLILWLGHESKHPGQLIRVDLKHDYPICYCETNKEFPFIVKFLQDSGFIKRLRSEFVYELTMSGWNKYLSLKENLPSQKNCFVARWFTPEIDKVYDKAIKPAIELQEDHKTTTGFKAFDVGREHHTNDINNEIIAQIKNCKFMVCDLTGYRGGVYFEAGFAMGLRKEVIFTCREDWIERSPLYKDSKGKDNIVEELYDKKGKVHKIAKEGIHFDLEHRKHIKWSKDKPGDLEKDLRNCIQAVIA